MSAIGLVIHDNDFQAKYPLLLQMARNPRQVKVGIGREGANLLKAHFRLKDRTGANQLSDRRTHFWLEVGRSVQSPVTSDSSNTISIWINDPRIAQKVYGGPIVAKRVANLAIPVSPDAYGRSPAVFEAETGLKLFVLKQGGTESNPNETIILAAARGNGQIEVEYILKHRVNQDKDPTALPDMTPASPFTQSLIKRGQSIVDRQLSEGGLN